MNFKPFTEYVVTTEGGVTQYADSVGAMTRIVHARLKHGDRMTVEQWLYRTDGGKPVLCKKAFVDGNPGRVREWTEAGWSANATKSFRGGKAM